MACMICSRVLYANRKIYVLRTMLSIDSMAKIYRSTSPSWNQHVMLCEKWNKLWEISNNNLYQPSAEKCGVHCWVACMKKQYSPGYFLFLVFLMWVLMMAHSLWLLLYPFRAHYFSLIIDILNIISIVIKSTTELMLNRPRIKSKFTIYYLDALDKSFNFSEHQIPLLWMTSINANRGLL